MRGPGQKRQSGFLVDDSQSHSSGSLGILLLDRPFFSTLHPSNSVSLAQKANKSPGDNHRNGIFHAEIIYQSACLYIPGPLKCMVCLPTFTMQINQMLVNTPYIECLGNNLYKTGHFPTFSLQVPSCFLLFLVNFRCWLHSAKTQLVIPSWPKEANKHKEEYWGFPKIGVGPLPKWMVKI